MKKCVKCGKECTGDLSNFIDKKTKLDVKGRLGDFDLKDLIYESPVCLEHYHMTSDDLGWLTGTGYYSQ